MTDEPKASRREWTGLAVLALPCLLYSMDLIVLELAVPKLSADLKPTSSQLLWIMDVYGFLLAGIVECPSSSWTNLVCTPFESRIVAHVWPRSWNIICGNPALARKRPERTLCKVVPVQGRPYLDGEQDRYPGSGRPSAAYFL